MSDIQLKLGMQNMTQIVINHTIEFSPGLNIYILIYISDNTIITILHMFKKLRQEMYLKDPN